MSTPPGWYADATDPAQQRYWGGARWTEHVVVAAPAPPVAYLPVTDQRTNSAEVAIAWVATVVTVGYFLPWAIAATRGKANSIAILVINLLLGWTVVGWIVALVMACGAHQVRTAVVRPGP